MHRAKHNNSPANVLSLPLEDENAEEVQVMVITSQEVKESFVKTSSNRLYLINFVDMQSNNDSLSSIIMNQTR